MAKNSVADWSTTAANNTDIGGITLSDATQIDALDDITRALMAQIKTAIGVSFQAYDAATAKKNAVNTWTAAQTFSGAVTVGGAFTSIGIDDNATGERVQVSDIATTLGTAGAVYVLGHAASDQALYITGDSSSSAGASLRLFGSTHASQASDWDLRQGTTPVLAYDHSATQITASVAFVNPAGRIEHGAWSATGATRGSLLTSDASTGFLLTSATTTASTQHARFYNPNGLVGSIATSASATSFNTSSDERIKDGFVDFDSGTIVDAIQVFQYEWKADGTTGYGPKAQELYAVFPQAVTPGNDKEPGDSEFVPWSYDASKLVPVLLREIQSLRARVAALEA